MRHIRVSYAKLKSKLPHDWDAKALKALEAVRAANPKDKNTETNRHSDVWGDVKPFLRELSHKKCWYCEGLDRRFDGVVDHFRPKGKVAGVAHPGYWWLAFDLKNFRYSCTYCNSRRKDQVSGESGGKQDAFPLIDETKRAFPEEQPDRERPVLLDPLVAADALFFYFADDGDIHPRFSNASQGQIERVSESAKVYHLNHPDLVDARLELFNEIHLSVELGKAYFLAWCGGDENAEAGYNAAVESLKTAIAEEAEFSTAARDIVKGMREEGHPWLDGIL